MLSEQEILQICSTYELGCPVLARQRAADMRRQLSRASVQVDKTQLPLVSSIGVVTVDRLLGESVNEASNSIFEALLATLYRAKEKGGNTVEIHNSTKF